MSRSFFNMNHEKIDIFDYDIEIKKLPEEWMEDMATVFREFDENRDGKVPPQIARHIFHLFRLPSKGLWEDQEEQINLGDFLEEAAGTRDSIFIHPKKRYMYYFKMIACLGKNTIDAVDIQRFISVSGDNIDLKYCEDFIDEFDRKNLSKDSITPEEFGKFCAKKKIPV
ncbi:hypothetical protein TRFO_25537 [Tritrichomonas foetus]|uniref:Uncharacterized protein n=1 Tax=Tritrichomonas foetus TaxID=1144522 RepID=A0A1J4K5F4_9EUKA|nr:hypothetical protein TRFO_25537 [Tritrichomonas foetus]|eukprot:OHT06427.1 hypothetical protein TRFO_25537 [Tritrichomonas foetus]